MNRRGFFKISASIATALGLKPAEATPAAPVAKVAKMVEPEPTPAALNEYCARTGRCAASPICSKGDCVMGTLRRYL